MNPTFGIRREDKNPWERRAPIIPGHLAELLAPGRARAIVQPSSIRAFDDEEYRSVGAEVDEDLGPCQTIFALKEIPTSLLLPDKTYLFFSHTIKGQAHNMPLLRRIMGLGDTLIDYEKITDDDGRRLVGFSRQAGQAGLIDALHVLGLRLAAEGFDTPLKSVSMAHTYANLSEARAALRVVGSRIVAKPLPGDLNPLVFAFLGQGSVSRGAQELCDLLPCAEVTPAALRAGQIDPEARLVKVVFDAPDTLVRRRGTEPFDFADYLANPGDYRSIFEEFLPFLHVVVNGIYWEPGHPRPVPNSALAALFGGGERPHLRVLADISCDIEGGIECTRRATTLESPAFVYEPGRDRIVDGVDGEGPVVLAVDNLPCELPVDSSLQFSESLRRFLPPVIGADTAVPFAEYAVPPEIKRAVIVYNGQLTEDYRYLRQYL